MTKIIKKFIKNHFETKDNVIDRKIFKRIDAKKCFTNNDAIAELINEIN